MSTVAKIHKAFNRLVASADGKRVREQLLHSGRLSLSEAAEDQQAAADLNRKAIGQLVTLAKRKGEFALATYLRTTPHSFEIR